MFKVCTYILTAIIFTQALGFKANIILSLDDIWSHYQIHQEEFGDDLLTFVNLHYGSLKSEHQDEHDGHENLPVADFNHIQSQILFITEANFNIQAIEINTPKPLHVVYIDNYFSNIITEVFQPPKHFDWS